MSETIQSLKEDIEYLDRENIKLIKELQAQKEQTQAHKDAANRIYQSKKKVRQQATLWEGKYRIVCHENNKLRKQMNSFYDAGDWSGRTKELEKENKLLKEQAKDLHNELNQRVNNESRDTKAHNAIHQILLGLSHPAWISISRLPNEDKWEAVIDSKFVLTAKTYDQLLDAIIKYRLTNE